MPPPVSPPPSSRDDTDAVSTSTLKVITVNVSADTYYYGPLISAMEDPTEENLPGRLVAINDYRNTSPQAHWTNNNMAPDQAYLAQIGLVYGPDTGINGCKIKLEITDGANKIRLWRRSQPTGSCNGVQLTGGTYVIGTDTVPNPMYLEGIEEGNVMLEATFLRPDNSEVMRDKVRIKIVNVFDIDSNSRDIQRGVGLDPATTIYGAGTTTSIRLYPNELSWRPFSISLPEAPITNLEYCLYRPVITPTPNQSLIAGLLTDNKTFNGIFGVTKDLSTGTKDIRLRVCAGIANPDGSITRGLIAEKTLHLNVSDVAVNQGSLNGLLSSNGSGPFRRVMTGFGNYNGLLCDVDLPVPVPSQVNVVTDMLSLDSAYVYIRGDVLKEDNSTYNLEIGLQAGHSDNPGWIPYKKGTPGYLLVCDDPLEDVLTGSVNVDYRTTGHPLEVIDPTTVVCYFNGHRYHFIDPAWDGNKPKLIGRVTSIGQFGPQGSRMNGPLSANSVYGLYTSGSYLKNVSWINCKPDGSTLPAVDWTYNNIQTLRGSYPGSPWVVYDDSSNGGATDIISEITTIP